VPWWRRLNATTTCGDDYRQQGRDAGDLKTLRGGCWGLSWGTEAVNSQRPLYGATQQKPHPGQVTQI